MWAPGHGILDRVEFPAIRTFDSSRTPKRGERLATPRTLAEVDLTAIVAALTAAETEDPGKPKEDPRRHAQLEAELATAKARIDTLEQQNRELDRPAGTDCGPRCCKSSVHAGFEKQSKKIKRCEVDGHCEIPSGGSLYRTRRNLRSPSLKFHVAAAWNER